MSIALAVLAGLVWGALAALLGGVITRRSLAKNSTAAVLIGNLLRTLTDPVLRRQVQNLADSNQAMFDRFYHLV